MSALVLCRECLSWAEPLHDACPVCSRQLDLSQPDPAPEDLRDAIGRVARCLGEVTTPRKLLPDRGLLFVTTGGFFFLPHGVARRIVPVERTGGASRLWSAATSFRSQRTVAGALAQLRNGGPREVTILVPRHVAEGDGEAAAAFLMDEPGAFFIHRRSVQCVRRTWRGWLVKCRDRRSVRFRPSDPATFAAGLGESCRADWTSVPGSGSPE